MPDGAHRIDPLAEAFAGIAEGYDRARPGYAREPVEWAWRELGLPSAATVVDLAAGTGKLTQALAGLGAHVVAVEPQAQLRAVLERRVPGAVALDGTAESIPLADGAADAVFVGEAFHWFDGDRALPEIHRVLRPQGGLALLWNHGEWHDHPWSESLFARLDALPTPDVRPENRPHTKLWREPFQRTGLFGPLVTRSFDRVIELGVGEIVDLIESWSYVAARPAAEREQLRRDLAAILVAHTGAGMVALEYRTEVDLTRRR